MRLNLKNIINVPGGVCPFSYALDLSDLEFGGAHPIDQPVQVTGQVRNMAGALVLEGTAATTLHLVCDRCAKPFAREKTVRLETLLAQELAAERSDDEIVLLDGDEVDLDDVATTAEELDQAFTKGTITEPSLARRNIITQFSGLRAHLDTDDFVVGESSVKGFYNVAGIESPGLTCAPAIAVDVAEQIANKLQLKNKLHFEAKRKAIPHFATMSNTEREKLIERNPLYGRIVCRCEVVTEGEIVDAIRRNPGAKDLDGVKRRTRAGMGRCQAGFCSPRVMEILARELGCDMMDITKGGGSSNVVIGRTK